MDMKEGADSFLDCDQQRSTFLSRSSINTNNQNNSNSHRVESLNSDNSYAAHFREGGDFHHSLNSQDEE